MDEPGDMYELFSCCEKYINLVEVLAAEKEDKSEKKLQEKKDESVREAGLKCSRDDKDSRRKKDERKAWVPKTELEPIYTALTYTRAHILNEIKDQVTLRWPAKMVKPAHERNKNKYCRFHQDHGHDTKECRQLKDEIEAFIQRGRLGRFVKKEGNDRRPDYRAREPKERPRSPAKANKEEQPQDKRRRMDQPITFSDEDLANIQFSHDDALVIKMFIANYVVGRILVDSGSSVDILYYDAFKKMLLKPEMLKRVESPLYGFNRAPIQVKGSIELLVTVGMEPKLATVKMNFLVVKVNSSHNGILGRLGLNTVQVVVSTPHLMMKFPTDHGIGEC
ncbi:uncharacterized protein LOC122662942 [Telopea speciosissima]|uniref:uncharacterized protein LOC122662942 n=1 Tax=Telopea speciosissima TaxID=54955 RepID=UPI001CC509BE|nr:uncharacterized protein LOC122662942 [Telopea speciosissima]